MADIAARLLVRFALVAASLSWAGYVFTHTVGDPDRAERVASAVLADDEARSEIVEPVTQAVLRSTGLPADQEALVATEVDRILQDPAGARAFIDPFVGSWAEVLGIDDPRPTEFDVMAVMAQIPALQPVLAASPPLVESAEDVPLPRSRLGWVGGFRTFADNAVLPLAVLAVVLAFPALVIGDRRWVLRRLGAWGVGAGVTWVVLPPVSVWAARRWATGADAVVDVAVREAMTGLTVPAGALVTGGLVVFVGSFLVPHTVDRTGRSAPPAPRHHVPPTPAETRRPGPPPAAPLVVPQSTTVTQPAPAPVGGATTRMPVTATDPTPPVGAARPPDRQSGDDDLWDFYTRS